MKKAKKNWEKPELSSLNGSKVESGVVPAPEGSHFPGSVSGSWAMGRIS